MSDPRDQIHLHKLPKEFSPYNLKRWAEAVWHPGPMRDSLLCYSTQWERERMEQDALLRQALEALERCYDVAEWPADGKTTQDAAIAAIRKHLGERG